MRTAILGAVAAVGVTAGMAPAQYISGGVVIGGPVYRPAPVVYAPAPVVVAPSSGLTIGVGIGGFTGVYSTGGYAYPAYGYRPSYGYPSYGYPSYGYGGYRPYYGGGYGYGHHHHHGW